MNDMEKNVFEWVAFILLFIWQLPQNILGLCFLLYFKLVKSLELVDKTKWSYAFKSKYMTGGISLGTFCFLSRLSAERKEDVAHELVGHTFDSRLMGPLYLIIIGLPSILNAMFDFTECYFDFYPEKRANNNAGLEVDEHCRLKFKEEQ